MQTRHGRAAYRKRSLASRVARRPNQNRCRDKCDSNAPPCANRPICSEQNPETQPDGGHSVGSKPEVFTLRAQVSFRQLRTCRRTDCRPSCAQAAVSFRIVHRLSYWPRDTACRSVYPFRYFAAEGGLMSYGPDQVDQWRGAATYVDRILRGESSSRATNAAIIFGLSFPQVPFRAG
jgi:hypothetical protein